MTKYHPLDVRYKGPSTAYRGSAHDKAKVRKASSSKPAMRPNPSSGPWSGNKAAQPPRQMTPPRPNPATAGGFGPVLRGALRAGRTIKNVYIAFLLIVLVALFFGNPSTRMTGINIQPQEMVSMPTR